MVDNRRYLAIISANLPSPGKAYRGLSAGVSSHDMILKGFPGRISGNPTVSPAFFLRHYAFVKIIPFVESTGYDAPLQ
jgi:hypothetical protein